VVVALGLLIWVALDEAVIIELQESRFTLKPA